jgi:hypothetical protein
MRIPSIGGFKSPTTLRPTLTQDCPGPIMPSPIISRGQRPPLIKAYRRYPTSSRPSPISQHILRYTQGIADSIQVYIARTYGKNQPTMSMDRSRLIAENLRLCIPPCRESRPDMVHRPDTSPKFNQLQ